MKRAIQIIMILLLLVSFSCEKSDEDDSDNNSNTTTTVEIPNQIQFIDLEEMNEKRAAFGYCQKDEFIYVFNGFTDVLGYSEWGVRYDIANDTWDIFSNNLIAKRYTSSSIVNNKIYIFNGYIGNGQYNDKIEVVDIATGNLIELYENPYPRDYAGSAVLNNNIYIFGGGTNNGPSDKLYRYNTLEDDWTELASMPEAKSSVRGEIVNNKLYVFGGYYGETSDRIDVYSINNNSWEFIDNMPEPISANAIAVQKNLIWIVGDYNQLTYVAAFNTKTDEFKVVQSNITGRRHAGASVYNNKLYVYGGAQTSSLDSALDNLQYAVLND